MGTVFAPHRLFLPKLNIVHRTFSNTQSASSTGFTCFKVIRLYNHFIKNRVHWSTHQTVIQIIPRYRKFLLLLNTFDCCLNIRFRFCRNLLCLIHLRCIEHGDIILRHNNLCCSHIVKLFLFCQAAIILCCITNFTATIHHKPDTLRTCPFCFRHPFRNNFGNTPCISRCHHDDITAGIHCCRIVIFNSGI